MSRTPAPRAVLCHSAMCAAWRHSPQELTVPRWALQTGEWVLTLEGVCRLAVSGASIPKQQQHYEVEVEVLRPRCLPLL